MRVSADVDERTLREICSAEAAAKNVESWVGLRAGAQPRSGRTSAVVVLGRAGTEVGDSCAATRPWRRG